MFIGEMFMDCPLVTVTLHATFECCSGKTYITYLATLASVVRTFKLIYDICLAFMARLGRSTVSHDQGCSEVRLAIRTKDDFFVRRLWRYTPLDDTSNGLTFLLEISTICNAVIQNNRLFGAR